MKLAIFLLPLGLALSAETTPHYEVIPLHNGFNAIDLDENGTPDNVIVAHRENFNAHGFEVTTFLLKLEDAKGGWQVVPFTDRKNPLFLQTGGGADALLEDFRLLRDPANHRTLAVTAKRDFGETYADTRPVTFTFYELQKNEEGSPGRPWFFFEPTRSFSSSGSYSDVTTAFREELHLAHDGKPGLRPESMVDEAEEEN